MTNARLADGPGGIRRRNLFNTNAEHYLYTVPPLDYSFTAIRSLNLFNDTAYTVQIRTSVLYI
jgi:hypothetical protein